MSKRMTTSGWRASFACCCFCLTALASLVLINPAWGEQSDVLVYGATPSGIAAAVSAAKSGARVTLVEPTDRIGGLVTSGLSNTDFRSLESLTGFFRDFADRVLADYQHRYGAASAQAVASFQGTHGEPSVNLRILQQMLAEQSRITVVTQSTVVSVIATDLIRGRQRIVAASFRSTPRPGTVAEPPTTIHAKFYIDASYEGDLMALAHEPFAVGRESRRQYGEPLAGNARGEADGQVQGYNFRLVMTEVAENKLMPVAPTGYDREDFAAILQIFTSGRRTRVFADDRSGIFRAHMPLLPNGKADVNDTPHAPVRLSMPDINDAYPTGDAATRERIVQQHRYYNVGLLYFLQNDAAVPIAIRNDARRWGWCRDEFAESGGIPPKLYIREARRLVGQHVFTGHDTMPAPNDARGRLHRDSIAIGDYVHNCHGTGRSGSRFDGEHDGEFYKHVPPYQIPYGVIVPTKSENLLVPCACSASHFGFGALRLEPIWCSLGQAAGWASSICIAEETPAQSLDIDRLQDLLHADRSATIYVSDVPPTAIEFPTVQWLGTRGAFHGLAAADQPKPTSLGGQYSEAFPGHAVELDKPLDAELAKRWTQLVTEAGADVRGPFHTRRDFVHGIRKRR